MELNGQTTKVVLRDLQIHPFKPLVLHIDFQRVDANTKRAQEGAAALHQAKRTPRPSRWTSALINHVVTELDVTCMPCRPARVHHRGPVQGWTRASRLHLDDIQLPKGVKAVTHGKQRTRCWSPGGPFRLRKQSWPPPLLPPHKWPRARARSNSSPAPVQGPAAPPPQRTCGAFLFPEHKCTSDNPVP